MFQVYVILFTLIISFFCIYTSKKFKILIDEKYTPHKSFASKELTPIIGGLIFLICSLVFLSFENYYLKIFLSLIFLIGLLSDVNFLFSPLRRFLLQVVIISLIIYFSQNFINSIRIPLIQNYFENIYFKYLFTLFCYLVLINGSNFMDGVNSLFLGYFLSAAIACFFVFINLGIDPEVVNFKIILIIISILYLLNFFGKLFIGDSGAYLISFLIGYYLIYITNLSIMVSPYFAACLLWYPALECLFSIIRKRFFKLSAVEPDNKHLHQLIFLFLKKKIDFKTKVLNTLSGTIINAYNVILFVYAYNNIFQTKNLVLAIIVSTLIYNLTYFYLVKILKN